MKRWLLALVLACVPLGIDNARAANPEHVRQLQLVNACAGCDLSGADLRGQTFINANLAGANLSGADLSNTDLSLSNLENANLEGANLTSAYLYGVNLNNTALKDSTFIQTTLRGATIEGTNFCLAKTIAGADFTGAYSGAGSLPDRKKSRFQRYAAKVVETFTLKDPKEHDICVEMLQAFANPRQRFPADSPLRLRPNVWNLMTQLRLVEFELAKAATKYTDQHPAYIALRQQRAVLMERLKESVGRYCLGQEPATETPASSPTDEVPPPAAPTTPAAPTAPEEAPDSPFLEETVPEPIPLLPAT